MTPIVSTLVSAGIDILDRLISGGSTKASEQASGLQDFSQYMRAKGVEKPASELALFLKNERITDFSQIDQMRQHLTTQLLHDPQVSKGLSGKSALTSLSLNLEEGGDFTVKTQDGKSVRIPKGSEAAETAMRIHQLNNIKEMSKFTSLGLYDIADKAASASRLSATWLIRGSNGVSV